MDIGADVWTGVKTPRIPRPNLSLPSITLPSLALPAPVAARIERWRFADLQDESRDMVLLTLLMGLVAGLMTFATLWTSDVPGPYTTQLEQQHAEWVANQPDESADIPVVTAVAVVP